MKNIIKLLTPFVFLFSFAVHADVPSVLNYSGTLTTDAGPYDGAIDATFTIYNSATDAGEDANLWQATISLVVVDGSFHATLGNGDDDNPVFPDNLWDAEEIYLGVQVGTEAEMSPRMQVSSVPYALAAVESAALVSETDGNRVTYLPTDFAMASDMATALAGKADSSHTHALADITAPSECNAGDFVQTAGDGTFMCSPMGQHVVMVEQEDGSYRLDVNLDQLKASLSEAFVNANGDNDITGSLSVNGGSINIASATNNECVDGEDGGVVCSDVTNGGALFVEHLLVSENAKVEGILNVEGAGMFEDSVVVEYGDLVALGTATENCDGAEDGGPCEQDRQGGNLRGTDSLLVGHADDNGFHNGVYASHEGTLMLRAKRDENGNLMLDEEGEPMPGLVMVQGDGMAMLDGQGNLRLMSPQNEAGDGPLLYDDEEPVGGNIVATGNIIAQGGGTALITGKRESRAHGPPSSRGRSCL